MPMHLLHRLRPYFPLKMILVDFQHQNPLLHYAHRLHFLPLHFNPLLSEFVEIKPKNILNEKSGFYILGNFFQRNAFIPSFGQFLPIFH
jgi:hypothetical protein